MSDPVLIGIAVVALGAAVVWMMFAGPLAGWAHHPIGVLCRGHLVVLAIALTIPACLAMVVSLAGRVKLNREIRQSQVTRADVRRLVKFTQPTQAEQLRRIGAAIDECAGSATCRRKFVRTVNRIVRVTGESIVPAPAKGKPMPRRQRTVVVHEKPKTVTVIQPSPPAPGAPQDGKDGKDGKDGRAGKDVDSAVLDGLDNRLANVEDLTQTLVGGLRALVGRVDLVERLTAALCRLLTPGRC